LITYSPSFVAAVLRKAEKLKVISGHSCSAVICQAARQQGIVVTVVPGLWDTVADFTVGLLMASARNIPQAHWAIKQKQWHDMQALKILYSGRDIYKKTVGIIGLGRIGARVAKRLTGFDAHLVYYDRVRKPDLEASLGIEFLSFEDLLSGSDYIVLLAALDDVSTGMMGKEQFNLVKPGSILVNTGRGKLVDEHALVQALAAGRLAGAALDVYHSEPLEFDHPLMAMENVILAPHLGGSTFDCDMVLVTDVMRVLRGEPPIYPLIDA
jgi:phosphoglycerate dehydrogenase-like enzyme